MIDKIGHKIKHLREAKEISADRLARTSELDIKEIELIENGELMPSMPVLIRITRALGIRLGTILDGEESSCAIVTRSGEGHYTHNISKGSKPHTKNHEFFSLAIGKADRNMEPFMIETQYLRESPDNYSKHEGEEFIFVLEGEAEIHYGVQVYKLHTGDSIYYDSLVPHFLSSAKEGTTAKVLAVTYTPI